RARLQGLRFGLRGLRARLRASSLQGLEPCTQGRGTLWTKLLAPSARPGASRARLRARRLGFRALRARLEGLARKAFCSGRKTGSLAYKAPGPTVGIRHAQPGQAKRTRNAAEAGLAPKGGERRPGLRLHSGL